MPTPDYIAALDPLFKRAVRAIESARAEVRDINAEIGRARGESYDSLKWEGAAYDQIGQEARRFGALVARIAVRDLSRPGQRLEIDAGAFLATFTEAEHELREKARRGRGEDFDSVHEKVEAVWAKFKPSQVWAAIAAKYTPDAVAAEAAQRAASCIVSDFGLARHPEIKTVGGRVEMTRQVWTEDNFRGGRQMSYHARESMAGLGEAFHTFATQALTGEEADGVRQLSNHLRSLGDYGGRRELNSRERFRFDGNVDLVTFTSAVKIYLPASVAEALNSYLSTHCPSAFERDVA